MLTIRAMTGGEGYGQRHLQQSDYYDHNRTAEGRRHGRGAELLGLKGEATSEDFRGRTSGPRLTDGRIPPSRIQNQRFRFYI